MASYGALLVGWYSIIKGLGGFGVRMHEAESLGLELMAKGAPIWFVPELDNRPRADKGELIRWAKKRGAGMASEKLAAVNKE
jgi:hypothetical protein